MRWSVIILAGLALSTAAPSLASAAACNTDFDTWIADFKVEADAAGVSRSAQGALDGLKPDPAIIKLDHNQHYFKQSFETYRSKRVPPGKVASGIQKLRANEGFFKRLEQKYGVPGPVLVAIWGLETGFGSGTGNVGTIRSLATLAHDCRRSDFFKNELINALKIIQHGDLTEQSMKGGWAGELGQTQFLPSSYIKFAVDGDGDGHRDLIHSWPDALASTANYLKATAGSPASPGTRAPPISASSPGGTRPRSTARRSPGSPPR